MYVGSNKVIQSITIDTGSDWLWISGQSCSTSVCTYSPYNYSASTTYSSLGKTYNEEFGIGAVSGTLATESFYLAGSGAPVNALTGFEFFVATTI